MVALRRACLAGRRPLPIGFASNDIGAPVAALPM
jgi:hypothetical protein